MENRIKILIEEIESIQEQYVAEVGTGGRKVWPKAIKERVLELDSLVGSTKKAAELSGVSAETLYLWRSLNKKKSNFKALTVVDKKDTSATVTVTNEKPIGNLSRSVTVTIRTPKGYVIEGLSSELALKFLLRIGAR